MKKVNTAAVWVIALACWPATVAGGQVVPFFAPDGRFDIQFVEVGHPVNSVDRLVEPGTVGAVPYRYYISKYEITREMVTRMTADSLYTFSSADMTSLGGNGFDRPATGISWYEAAIFVNWLNQEHGFPQAYNIFIDAQLWKPSDPGYDPENPYRNRLANYYLPTLDEWYKAAYYDPELNGGLGGYHTYPTRGDDPPAPVAAGTMTGTAVYEQLPASGPADVHLAGGASAFGTVGQGGNIFEWTETSVVGGNSDIRERRWVLGGWWNGQEEVMRSSNRNHLAPLSEENRVGFRVVARSLPITVSPVGINEVRSDSPDTLTLVVRGVFLGGYQQLEASADMTDWSPIGGAFWADEATIIVRTIDTAASGGRHFFRVRPIRTIGIETVAVGNVGNRPDTNGTPNPVGAVAYAYRIGKYEVTNTQYTYFLNAVAAADANGLYDTRMGSDPRGGIARRGAPGRHTYSVRGAMGDKPVNWVSWYDAARFCNWLHNNQPRGRQDGITTEDGAYTLTGRESIQLPGTDLSHGANGRNAGARFWLPGEDEWYKAAYHGTQVGFDIYWNYPMRSNNVPTVATADFRGNIDNDSNIIANYFRGADWNELDGNVTTVGSGGTGSSSFYGAFDMGGNVQEWTEQFVGTNRVCRGGGWGGVSVHLSRSSRISFIPRQVLDNLGFRVARR